MGSTVPVTFDAWVQITSLVFFFYQPFKRADSRFLIAEYDLGAVNISAFPRKPVKRSCDRVVLKA